MLTATIHNIVFPTQSSLLFFDTYLEPCMNIFISGENKYYHSNDVSNCFLSRLLKCFLCGANLKR